MEMLSGVYWGQMFWGCLTLFFLVLFFYKALKKFEQTAVSWYFRMTSHLDVERDFSNRDLLKEINYSLRELKGEIMLITSDSKKPLRKQLEEMQGILDEIKSRIDE